MKKILVLLSGGIDSTICLALAVKEYGKDNVSAISIYYGQKNEKELQSAKNVAKYYGVKYEKIDISNIYKNCSSSMIKSSNKDIPLTSYDEQVKKIKNNENVSTNVPFRNGLFLSICASYSINNNIDEIYYGIHREEGIARALYPDCDEDFDMAMNLAVYLGSGKKVKIKSPLCSLLKKDIIKKGIELNVPFKLTWTCYNDWEKPCCKCTACTDRIKGFKCNNMLDPIL